MRGISGKGKNAIAMVIEEMFDSLAMDFIGEIPSLKNKKKLIISSQPNLGLSNLFISSMASRSPTPLEEDLLKGLLESANGYIDSLKSRTKSNIVEGLDGLVREKNSSGTKVTPKDIAGILGEEMKKAKDHMQLTVRSEATKFRNMGHALSIAHVSASTGDSDPDVIFVMVRDGVTCKECVRLHLMPDKITPRVYKLSELKHSYHKRGNDTPSVFGLHPGCRCTLAYLPKNFGFDSEGLLKYVKEGYSAYSHQKDLLSKK